MCLHTVQQLLWDTLQKLNCQFWKANKANNLLENIANSCLYESPSQVWIGGLHFGDHCKNEVSYSKQKWNLLSENKKITVLDNERLTTYNSSQAKTPKY